MRRSFTLALKPFSVNQMYAGRRDFKTAACKDWECLFLNALSAEAPQKALKDLREAFDPTKNCYRMRLTWHSPDLLTKNGALNSRCFDVTNTEKIIVDLVFLPKYHVQSAPYGAKNLNIDDKYLMTLSSGKRYGPKWEIKVTIWLEEVKKYIY